MFDGLHMYCYYFTIKLMSKISISKYILLSQTHSARHSDIATACFATGNLASIKERHLKINYSTFLSPFTSPLVLKRSFMQQT